MSDVRGHLDEPGKQGRRDKTQIDLFHARFESLDKAKKEGPASNLAS